MASTTIGTPAAAGGAVSYVQFEIALPHSFHIYKQKKGMKPAGTEWGRGGKPRTDTKIRYVRVNERRVASRWLNDPSRVCHPTIRPADCSNLAFFVPFAVTISRSRPCGRNDDDEIAVAVLVLAATTSFFSFNIEI